MRRALAPILIVLLLTATACQSHPPSGPAASAPAGWAYTDLRALQSPAGVTPAQALIALYTRLNGADLQIRLDLLDSQNDHDSDLYLAIDARPGGSRWLPIHAQTILEWDRLISIPASGQPRVYAAPGKEVDIPGLSVARDPALDMVVLTLPRSGLPGRGLGFRVEALAAAPGGSRSSSHIGPARADAAPPGRARLLLAFSQALPGYTPAQALRRWDGAHTGPLGQRHGLAELLKAANKYHIPLTLLDLKTPPALSALDYLGKTSQIQQMAAAGLLILPDAPYGDPALPESLDASLSAARAFGFAASPILYGAISSPPERYMAAFAWLPGVDHILDRDGLHLIPLPPAFDPAAGGQPAPVEASPDGPTLAVRRALLAGALSANEGRLVVLGGPLPASLWADSTIAAPSFAWLAGHPWIQPLDGANLISLPACSQKSCGYDPARICAELLCLPAAPAAPLYTSAGKPYPAGLDAHSLENMLVQGLRTVSPGPARDLAWQMLFSLTDPSSDAALQRLRTEYLPQVSGLLEAARWEANPVARSDCSLDFDRDRIPDCILSSPDFFAALQSNGGRLLFAFARTSDGVTELVGPGSQFSVGLSDSSEWQPDLGPAGDPESIPGGFSDASDPFQVDQAQAQPGSVSFISPDGSLQKVYRLIPGGLQVEYHAAAQVSTQIPLAVAPQKRFTPGWGTGIRPGQTSRGYLWGWQPAPQVEILTNGSLTGQEFTQSYDLTRTIENPDQAYPPGHYLPFPLSLVSIQGKSRLTVQLLAR